MGFSRFNLSPSLQKSILNLGYAEPTPIQAHVIPEALNGRDIRACAQTGTGKTCAFLIPLIEKLIKQDVTYRPSVLILTPTRELAAQVHAVALDLTKGERIRTALVLGGANINTQSKQLRQGADIVVATPGRLLDLAERKSVSLHHVRTYVLDEADRMLDMGFLPDIRRITAQIPRARQTMLFSATYGPEVKQLTSQFLLNPVVVELSPSSTATSANVTQMVYPVGQGQKKAILQAILELGNMTSALIFTRTKHGANKLLIQLRDWGKKAAVIHSNRSQSQRQQALQGFKNREYQILVATDIAARGIDVKDISHVINYDVPRHAEDYVHRIGRTGRAQAVGEAFTLVSPDEEVWLKKIESFIKKSLPRTVIPDFPYQSKPRVMTATSQPTPKHPPHQNKPHSSHENRPRPSHFFRPKPSRDFSSQGHGRPHHDSSRPHQNRDERHSSSFPSRDENRHSGQRFGRHGGKNTRFEKRRHHGDHGRRHDFAFPQQSPGDSRGHGFQARQHGPSHGSQHRSHQPPSPSHSQQNQPHQRPWRDKKNQSHDKPWAKRGHEGQTPHTPNHQRGGGEHRSHSSGNQGQQNRHSKRRFRWNRHGR